MTSPSLPVTLTFDSDRTDKTDRTGKIHILQGNRKTILDLMLTNYEVEPDRPKTRIKLPWLNSWMEDGV